MSDFFQQAQLHGVDLPAVVGFLVGCVLAWWPGNPIVGAFHRAQIRRLLDRKPKMTLEQLDKEYDGILAQFDMRFAALIGITERFLYVYAVMFNQFSLLSGWLVMKAFFGWLGKPQSGQQQSLPFYHMYLFGNALSLLMGLLCGAIGLVVRTNVGLL